MVLSKIYGTINDNLSIQQNLDQKEKWTKKLIKDQPGATNIKVNKYIYNIDSSDLFNFDNLYCEMNPVISV